jgi:hypothetical protein
MEKKIIEHRFLVLEVDKKNKNHRNYPKAVVNKWIENDLLGSDNINEGYDLEYAVEDQDIYHEFTKGALSCGVINKLEIENDNNLYATVRFKLPEACNNLTERIYNGELNLNSIAVVPKGKGSVKNQTVQDDYELYGFNLISMEESSFHEEESKEEVQA